MGNRDVSSFPRACQAAGHRQILKAIVLGGISGALLVLTQTYAQAQAQRVVGTDVSYWNIGSQGANGISQTAWNTAYSSGGLRFAQLRATRGGTTGTSPSGGTSAPATLAERYDDPTFVQNLIRATAAGVHAGAYHFARPDVVGNTGTDDANHFLEMTRAWLRPGYLMPMYDLEAGSGGDALAQFAIDFSSRVYATMKIRPCVYINGNYSGILAGATQARRDALAKPPALTPSVISPAFPMLWNARYPDNDNPGAIPIQTGNPKNTYSTVSAYYGPWDDYGDAEPWAFWQYSSTVAIPGFPDTTCDADVSHGDLEYVRNFLIPAVWWTDSSGDWSVLANWNSGQAAVAPVTPADQPKPYATGGLPVPRLPGAAGSGPTSGQYDTVILERPDADITVTLSTGAHNIRKLYMRETLNITGGSLTINYNPAYRADDSAYVRHAGPISAQFSGPVSLSGAGSLSAHTLQVDRPFTISGGVLTINTIQLTPHSSAPGKLVLSGNATINPLANAAALIAPKAGAGLAGSLELGPGNPTLTIGNGAADVDLAVTAPVVNGGFTKAGAGTLLFGGANTYSGGTTIDAGRLLVTNPATLGAGLGPVTVNGGILAGNGRVAGLVTLNPAGTLAPGMTADLGTLTLHTPPALNGLTSIRINRNNGAPLSDKVTLTSGTLNYGGTLAVANTGAALTGGESFVIFSAPAYAGAFASSNLPPLIAGLNWYLGELTVNGAIIVNRPPLAGDVTVTNTPGQTLQIPIAGLTGAATDPDGNPLTLASFASATTNGVSLSSTATHILCENPANVPDQFQFTVTDGRGGLSTAQVKIVPGVIPPPLIVAGPRDLTVMAGEDATFSVMASSPAPVTYQWRFNGTNIAAASSSAYTRSSAQKAHEGDYSVVVSNSGGDSVTNATLTVVETSIRIESMAMLPDGQFQFQIRGAPGNYVIETTTNLQTWQESTRFAITNEVFEYVDPETNLISRGYRAKRIP